MVSYLPSTSKVNGVDSFLQNRNATLLTLREKLEMDQNCMKQQVEKHFSKHSFEEGYQEFL